MDPKSPSARPRPLRPLTAGRTAGRTARTSTARTSTTAAALVAVLAVAALAVTACAPPPPPATGNGMVVADRVDGFDRPWDLAFTPDGTALVTERPGRLAAVVGGARHVIAAVPGVVAKGEGGLLGLAVDPGFATNRYVYTCFANGSGSTVTDVRVVRFRVSEGLDALTGATPLLTGIPAGAGNRHLGCRVAVGPDGMLWVTTGDAAVASHPQDPTSLAGKVLRLTPAGAPAPGNPGGAWNPYVYTLGHRNPQGLAFRSSDGLAVAVEHGTSCDDEINRLVAGADFGWDPLGPLGPGVYDESQPMTAPGGVPALWSSGCPTVAPSGAAFLSHPRWGSDVGRLAVAMLKDQRLALASVSPSGAGPLQTVLSGHGRLRTVRQGPDGSLWVVQDASPGSLLRVVPG